MSSQRYSVTPHPIETLLTWVKSGEIAIPEIQRPFVWDATKVRNLLDSLFQGYPVGYLAEDLDIESVTEIFIRVNSAGSPLSQADFAMSKIAVNTSHGGNQLRKAIDYFCHLAIAPEFLAKIRKGDADFVASEFFAKMKWIADANDDIYDHTYTDMLRVAFTSEFGRGKLQDLVALLSGRNFETKQYEDAIAEASFGKLKQGILSFINKTHFDRITMILRSAGFILSGMIGSQNAINFAYILYLRGRRENIPAAELERMVRRWFAMSLLTGRYGGSPESTFDFDIRQIDNRGTLAYVESVIPNELPDSFWTGMLPQFMDTSSINSPYFKCFQAAQVKLGDRGFLSRDITVADLLLNRADVHHIYPKQHLKLAGLTRGAYNQIANFVITQNEINIAIGAKAPEQYFSDIAQQANGGKLAYGGIDSEEEMRGNFRMNCIPEFMLDGNIPDYQGFLEARRRLMALKMRDWFQML